MKVQLFSTPSGYPAYYLRLKDGVYDRVNAFPAPVSYTHLDVYKRQAVHPPVFHNATSKEVNPDEGDMAKTPTPAAVQEKRSCPRL